MLRLTLPRLLLLSVLLRLTLLLYGLYQDAHSPLPYTDIDYLVFSDASRSVYHGHSPYSRETYRYTPLLSYLLLPTVHFPPFGKLLFAASDVVAGWLIALILRRRLPERKALLYTATCWSLNPMVATISTRGSSEGLLGVMVITLLYFSLQRQALPAGILLGLATHFKLYPVLYAPSILLFLEHDPHFIKQFPKNLITPRRTVFALSAAGAFTGLNVGMYALYGQEFLRHTYLYHLIRLDHRHNFSPYNVLLYLLSPGSQASPPIMRWAFLPQLLLSGVVIPLATAKRDLPGCMFAQTFAFVAWNKVCTSQYFMWYIVLLPFVLGGSGFLKNPGKGWVALVAWVLGQAAWLYNGWRLEFLGESTFVELWAASLAFFVVNVWIVGEAVGDIIKGGGEVKATSEGANTAEEIVKRRRTAVGR